MHGTGFEAPSIWDFYSDGTRAELVQSNNKFKDKNIQNNKISKKFSFLYNTEKHWQNLDYDEINYAMNELNETENRLIDMGLYDISSDEDEDDNNNKENEIENYNEFNNNNNNFSLSFSTLNNNKRIKSNPTAGEIRQKELNNIYLSSTITNIINENKINDKIILEKKIYSLGKQCAIGLQSIGIRNDMTSELVNIIRKAYKIRKRRNLFDHTNSILTEEEEIPLQILDCVKKYDLIRLSQLLNLTIPREKTFGRK